MEDTSDFPRGIEAKEAPMWAKQVAEGELPSLSERLPQNPLVAKTDFDGYERPGPYGGTWQPIPYTSRFGNVENDSGVCTPHPVEI